ncbi:50S ribosomal protein L23 [Streptomyces clavuligerus]|nr:50S ribosomal protein L23 [Streptomyces clavuligerus]
MAVRPQPAPGAHPGAGPAEHVRRDPLRGRGLHSGRLRDLRVWPPGQRDRRERRLMTDNAQVTVTSKTFSDPHDILVKPVVSEKSYALLDENKYTFVVDPRANKTQIKQAIEKVFSVKVTGVNTINRQGKRKRTRTGFGKRANTKRAIVTLAEGDRIDIFGQAS